MGIFEIEGNPAAAAIVGQTRVFARALLRRHLHSGFSGLLPGSKKDGYWDREIAGIALLAFRAMCLAPQPSIALDRK